MGSMFYIAGRNAITWNIGDLSNWNTSKVIDMSYMFYCAGYSAITFNIGDLSNWNTSNVTNMIMMFFSSGFSATTWSIGDLSNWNTSNVINMGHMFQLAGYSATTFYIGDLNTKTVTKKDGTIYTAWDVSNVTNMMSMFNQVGYNSEMWNVGNLSNWNTNNVTNMSYMFYYAGYSATTFNLDLDNWNTSNVTDMSYMFYRAGRNATTFDIGDLSNWNTSNVTNMQYMFYKAGGNATTWNIGNCSGWNANKVKNMNSLFYGNKLLKVLDLSGWTFDNSVIDMANMLSDCDSLQKILFNDNFIDKSNGSTGLPSNSWIRFKTLDGERTYDNTLYTTAQMLSFTKDTIPSIAGIWIKSFAIITYDANGGVFTNSSTQNVIAYDDSIFVISGTYEEPTNNDGLVFAGWYTDSNCTDGNEFDLNNITSSVTVYALWRFVGHMHIYNNTGEFSPCQILINDSSGWNQYFPCIYTESGWRIYFR